MEDRTPAEQGPAHDYVPMTGAGLLRPHLKHRHGLTGPLPGKEPALQRLHASLHDTAAPVSGAAQERPQGHPLRVSGRLPDDPHLTTLAFHGRLERVLRVLEDALDALGAVDPSGARSAASAVVRRMEARV